MIELSLAVLGVSSDVGGWVEGKVFAGVVCLSGVGEVFVWGTLVVEGFLVVISVTLVVFGDLEVVVTFEVEDFWVEAASIVEDLLTSVSVSVFVIFDVGLLVGVAANVFSVDNSAVVDDCIVVISLVWDIASVDFEVVFTFKVEDFCVEAIFIVEDVLAISLLVVVVFDLCVVFSVVVDVSLVENPAVLDDCRVVGSLGWEVGSISRFSASVLFKELAIKVK